MSRFPTEYLRHILDEASYLEQTSERTSKDRFLGDETLKRAFVRSLEVIGEATKNLPVEFREAQDHVDWRAIAGMRDKLIHGYFGVDYDIVWDVVANEIPVLRLVVEELIESGGAD